MCLWTTCIDRFCILGSFGSEKSWNGKWCSGTLSKIFQKISSGSQLDRGSLLILIHFDHFDVCPFCIWGISMEAVGQFTHACRASMSRVPSTQQAYCSQCTAGSWLCLATVEQENSGEVYDKFNTLNCKMRICMLKQAPGGAGVVCIYWKLPGGVKTSAV